MDRKPRLLITGASGHLGSYLVREAVQQGLQVVAWSGTSHGERFGVPLLPVDLADASQIKDAFAAAPTLVIHAGAMAGVAQCRSDPGIANQINVHASRYLAELAARAGARLVLVSTDLVFDGASGNYTEEDSPAPLSAYAATKAAAERIVLDFPRHAVVRVSLLYGRCLAGRPHFFDEQVRCLRSGQPVCLFKDEWRTPLSFLTAARALLDIGHSDCEGIIHVGGPERLSRLDMGLRLAKYLEVDFAAIVAASRESLPATEPRPRDTSLNSGRWRRLFPDHPWPNFEASLAELEALS